MASSCRYWRFLQFSKETEILDLSLSCQTHVPPSQGSGTHCPRIITILCIKLLHTQSPQDGAWLRGLSRKALLLLLLFCLSV